ncbi:hypothetical protein [Chitinophaga tropicalis]|uniref:Uncharacterized protein n=1 Tax=Chitinophaga tropicalis TaxID=2683588 RepID=A0A7K1UE08_9BACT|nr:hypothetical protein [Chitinophaga tropicalis]MVT12614.1 hypothetical protein [Chitinophaga tropicalis]
MSELSSLYVSIKTKQENLERFFQAKPVTPKIDQNWTSWWDSREMYGKSPLTKISYYNYDKEETNRAVFDSFKLDPYPAQGKEGREGWGFTMIVFSENYEEILPMLAWLKSIAPYLDAEDEGVAIIYDFFWSCSSVMAHLVFAGQQASLRPTTETSEIEPKVMAEANKTLQNAMDAIDAESGYAD